MATATAPANAVRLAGNRSRSDNWFFSGMAFLILVTVFVGFARTYFLAGVFRAHLPAAIIHIHGAAFTCWILLLVAQVSLVSARRVDMHRKLGLAGFGLATLMVLLGVLAATNALSRGMSPPGFPLGAETFYAIPLADMVTFATLIYFAYRNRANPSSHKRLILIATIALMDAPTGRPPFAVITGHQYMDSVFCMFFLLLLVAYDLWSLRRVHRATIFAGLFMIIVEQVRVPIGMSAPWHHFAGWVLSLTGH
jgi:hypothetical protein